MATHLAFFKGVIFILSTLRLMFTCASDQTYDKTDCYSQAQPPDSNYLCNSLKSSCNTFIVYRVQTESQTLSSIASLMSADLSVVYHLNKLTKSVRLIPGQDIIVPVICTCQNRHSRVELSYNYTSFSDHKTALADVACAMFEGLVKAQVLIDENQRVEVEPGSNVTLKVPLKCACPNAFPGQRRLYYVTYPVVQQDRLELIALKFNVTIDDIADANGLETYSTIYPQTTLLVPTYGPPEVDRSVVDNSPAPTSAFPVDNIAKSANYDSSRHYPLLGGGLVGIIVCLMLGFFGFVQIKKRYYGAKDLKFEQLSNNVANRMSNFSPDFITVMSELKHSVINFSLNEIREATNDFDTGNKLGSTVFIGRTNKGATYAMLAAESADSVGRTVNILTKINHLNIVKLIGCCYSKPPYLVFEYAENGSLRDCLSCKKRGRHLAWTTRKQIAFDLASALHYLHYSTTPSYLHCNITSRNVLITTDWRAKITGFGSAKPLMKASDKLQLSLTRNGYLAPECVLNGVASMKTDVYAFGVVLLELISAKEAVDDEGTCLKDRVRFLSDGSEHETMNGCSEKLRMFMDDALEGEYTLGSAVCVALLAKCCVDDDPQVRPNMNDVLKTLSTVV